VDESDAQSALIALGALARAPIRHFRFSVRGRLLKANQGDFVILTRRRGLQGTAVSTTGAIEAETFRILYLKKNYLTGIVEAIVHTNIIE
jgi:hypothetical protein